MTKQLFTALILSALLTMTGCKQDADITKLSPYLYDYAPVKVGHSVIYDVDSISFNYITPIQSIDTSHYQIKELITDTFYDNLGKLSYRIEVYKRMDTMQPFGVPYRVWYSTVSKNTYEKVEDDLRFIKLVFPPVMGVTWNGNSYLPASDTSSDIYQTYAGWVYKYTSVNAPFNINGLHFDSTTVVTEVNNQNLINSKVSRETYALHVGLIYKEWEVLNKQGISSTWEAPDSANGFRIRMRIHSYTP